MHGSLAYAVTLPRPAPYGYHGLTDANLGATLAVGNRTQPGIRFPDAIACSFLHEGHTLGTTLPLPCIIFSLEVESDFLKKRL